MQKFCKFCKKNLLFLFYIPIFTKHSHQFVYFIYLFNKMFILLQFFIISFTFHTSLLSWNPLTHNPSHHQRSIHHHQAQPLQTMHHHHPQIPLFCTKKLPFLFYTSIFTKHSHQFIYSTHLFNKIFILLQFFIILSLTTSLSHRPNSKPIQSPISPSPPLPLTDPIHLSVTFSSTKQ